MEGYCNSHHANASKDDVAFYTNHTVIHVLVITNLASLTSSLPIPGTSPYQQTQYLPIQILFFVEQPYAPIHSHSVALPNP